ncbi:MAG: sulfite exporter TauE/SafE family protein [Cyanobacteria bacterium J06650_10]
MMRIHLKNPTIQAVCVVWLLFLLLTATGRFSLSLYGEHYAMPITMVFGSLIAGATSEGGGAVAFPVMTLLLGISPQTARDFSLMIQSVGMLAAAYTIIRLRLRVIPQAIVWGSLGGAIGVCIGISWIGPRLDPAFLKLFFVSLWLSFGTALYLMNSVSARPIKQKMGRFDRQHALFFVATGILGGCVSGMIGSGLDIVVFSVLTLSFRIDEKVATPTSVVLMGVNACVGFLWRLLVAPQSVLSGLAAVSLPPIGPEVWNYWYVCIAIVVIGAPVGARLITRVNRMTIVYFLLVSIVVQFLGALLIVPWRSLGLGWLIVSSFVGGSVLFGALALFGQKESFSRRKNIARRENAFDR